MYKLHKHPMFCLIASVRVNTHSVKYTVLESTYHDKGLVAFRKNIAQLSVNLTDILIVELTVCNMSRLSFQCELERDYTLLF